ncbi:MAG: glycerol acyltransferase [Nocardioidaceae bacterium]|nr:glycerol acyltransferase [Nocardioidaceae bacterium]
MYETLPRTADQRRPHDYLLRGFGGAARTIVRRIYDVDVYGAEHFPASGPVVVAANHTGFADGPLMAIFAPRPLHALTKSEMFDGPMGVFLGAAGQIPLIREEASDLHAVRLALRVLGTGGAVGIFPEGTRGTGEMLTAHGGAAYLALVSGSPVLPLVFLGTRRAGSAATFPPRGSRFVMQYGEPLDLGATPWPRRSAEVARATEQVRLALSGLLQQAVDRHGIPTPGPLPDVPNKKEHHD